MRQAPVEQYLTARGYMTWSVDFHADDWTRIGAQEVVRRAIVRMEARGRGILLLHDIQPVTALALPEILRELKARGFKIVHVVPAGPDRPKTVTEPAQWAVRRAARAEALAARRRRERAGAGSSAGCPEPGQLRHREFRDPHDQGGVGPVARAPGRCAADPAVIVAASSRPFPSPGAAVLPVPGAHNFRYPG